MLDFIMQKFWRWCIDNWIPEWWAPNAMTLVGLIVNVFTCSLMVYYSPNAKQDIPSYALILAAIGLFIYQTLDACDGKQARRTKTSSSLGELFDHGCDAISTSKYLFFLIFELFSFTKPLIYDDLVQYLFHYPYVYPCNLVNIPIGWLYYVVVQLVYSILPIGKHMFLVR